MLRVHVRVVLAGTVALGLWGLLGLTPGNASAQQTTIGGPSHGLHEGFYERIGSSWSLQGRNWFARFGGLGAATPRFGGFNASGGGQFGFGFGGGGFSGNFFGGFAQGSSRSLTSQTPSITVMNGQQGFMSDTSQSPFVIGFIPTVGGFPSVGILNPAFPPPQVTGATGPTTVTRQYLEGLRRAKAEQIRAVRDNFDRGAAQPAHGDVARRREANQAPDHDAAGQLGPMARMTLPNDAAAGELAASRGSSAGRPAMSVAEARRAHEAQQAAAAGEAQVLMERARGAEEAGKANVAAIYYRMVARQVDGPLRQQALDRLQALKDSAAPQH